MILIVLFVISILVWVGGGWFIEQHSWHQVIPLMTAMVNEQQVTLFLPSRGILVFLSAGLVIVYLTYLWMISHAGDAVDSIHGKQHSFKLFIQSFPRTIWIDSMNDNTEPFFVWIAPVLARFIVIGFVLKFVVGVVLLLLSNWMRSNITAQPLISSMYNIAISLLKFATDVNGMLVFSYAVIAWFALVLYKREQVFIRDYYVMQQQLQNRVQSHN
jgi:hypothetical protein